MTNKKQIIDLILKLSYSDLVKRKIPFEDTHYRMGIDSIMIESKDHLKKTING